MWTFASFHAVSQSVFPMSLCKPPRKKRQISIFKKHSSCLEDWAQPTETKKIRTEPGVDFTPMHILCILGGISKPQIYLKKKKKKKKKRKNIDHVVRYVCKKRSNKSLDFSLNDLSYTKRNNFTIFLFCHFRNVISNIVVVSVKFKNQ